MLLFALALAEVGRAAPAAAPTDTEANVDAETGRPIKWLDRTEIIFEGVDVNGELTRPSTILTAERPRPKLPPLFEPRMNWDVEMKASVDDVK
jgi:hypothetical protein